MYALQFDGIQNYVNLGFMGNFGSSFGSGFFASFVLKTTPGATQIMSLCGFLNTGFTTFLNVGINKGTNSANVPGAIQVILRDNSAKTVQGNTGVTNINDGNIHILKVSAVGSTNTITITLDGIPLTINYFAQSTPVSFSNLGFFMVLGANNTRGTIAEFFQGVLNTVRLGNTSSVFAGSYDFNEGMGLTTADTSGNANNGVLQGSPPPLWVQSLISSGNGNLTLMGLG